MKNIVGMCVLGLSLTTIGCGANHRNSADSELEAPAEKTGASDNETASDKDIAADKDIEEFVKLDNEKGVVFAVGGDDCAVKAKSVGEWRKNNTKHYNELRKTLGEKYQAGPPEKYKEELAKNKDSVMGAMMKCAKDPAFDKMMADTSPNL